MVSLKVWDLTGKYNDGIPDDSRLNQPGYEFLKKELEACKVNGTLDKIRALTEFAAQELECSMTQLALRMVFKEPERHYNSSRGDETQSVRRKLGCFVGCTKDD